MSNYNPYFFLIGAALLLSAMGLWFTLIVPGIDRWSRRFFRIYFINFMLCGLSGFLEIAFQHIIVPDAAFIFLLLLETLPLLDEELLLLEVVLPLLTEDELLRVVELLLLVTEEELLVAEEELLLTEVTLLVEGL